jgi:hypothetical protein
MSFHRIAPDAGRIDPASLPRGPHGRPLCRTCAAEVPPRRRSFCSEACVHQWRLRTDPNYVRELVQRRDHGRCAHCRTCTESLRRDFARVPMRKRREWLQTHGIPWLRRFGRWWDADHIQPVAEGGGTCDLTNYQTLCLPCHRRKTTAQAERRQQVRQQQKLADLEQVTYTYRGDRLTAPHLRGATCQAVRRPDGKCIRGRNGTMLVRFADGTLHLVLGRQLRKTALRQPS